MALVIWCSELTRSQKQNQKYFLFIIANLTTHTQWNFSNSPSQAGILKNGIECQSLHQKDNSIKVGYC